MTTSWFCCTSLFVTLVALCSVACTEDRLALSESQTGRTNLERARALERLATQRTGGASLGEPELAPVLERLATQDPYGEVRQRALAMWLALPHPLIDDRLLLKVLATDPMNANALNAARAYHQLWGERGIRLLFQRFEECGAQPETAVTCHRLLPGLDAEPRLSMTLLMDARDTTRTPRPQAELALILASSLLRKQPALREDKQVIAWLEAFATSGETAGLRITAKELLARTQPTRHTKESPNEPPP